MKQILLCDNGDFAHVPRLCEKYGTGVEIQAFHNPEYIAANPDGFQAHLGAYRNVRTRSLHGPFADLCFGSADRLIREVTRQRFEYAYDIARKLGCRHIVLHHGYVPKTSHPPNWIRRSKLFWGEFLSDKAGDVSFHIENQLEFDPQLISQLIGEVGSPSLDVCLDIGHAHCNSRAPAIDWIESLKAKVGYVHLHDNRGEEDEHLGFGRGTIPLPKSSMCSRNTRPTPSGR